MMQNTVTPTVAFKWLFSYFKRYGRDEVDQGYKMLRPEWLRLRKDAPVGLSMRDIARTIEGLLPKQREVIERERERAERGRSRMAHKIGVRLRAEHFGSKER